MFRFFCVSAAFMCVIPHSFSATAFGNEEHLIPLDSQMKLFEDLTYREFTPPELKTERISPPESQVPFEVIKVFHRVNMYEMKEKGNVVPVSRLPQEMFLLQRTVNGETQKACRKITYAQNGGVSSNELSLIHEPDSLDKAGFVFYALNGQTQFKEVCRSIDIGATSPGVDAMVCRVIKMVNGKTEFVRLLDQIGGRLGTVVPMTSSPPQSAVYWLDGQNGVIGRVVLIDDRPVASEVVYKVFEQGPDGKRKVRDAQLADNSELNGLTAGFGKIYFGTNPKSRPWEKGAEGAVHSINLDGSNLRRIRPYTRSDGENGRPHFFFIDEPHGDVYWSENGWLYRAKMDGSEPRQIRSDLNEAGGIAVYGNFLYYLSEDDQLGTGQIAGAGDDLYKKHPEKLGMHVGHLYRLNLSAAMDLDGPLPPKSLGRGHTQILGEKVKRELPAGSKETNMGESLVTNLGQGRGMALDPDNGILYFISTKTKSCKPNAPHPVPAYCSTLNLGMYRYDIKKGGDPVQISKMFQGPIGMTFARGRNGEKSKILWAFQGECKCPPDGKKKVGCIKYSYTDRFEEKVLSCLGKELSDGIFDVTWVNDVGGS